MIVGILFAIGACVLSSIDTLINKDIMSNNSSKVHSILRILFVMPVLLIAALFDWHITPNAILWLCVYGVLEAINIFFHQTAIKVSNPLHIDLISKSKVLLVLIISFVLGIDSLSLLSSIFIVVFVIGTVLTINFQTEAETEEKTGFLGIVFEIISVLARCFKPFILKYTITNDLISSSTLAFLSMPIALIILLIMFRPSINFKEINYKKYILQAVVVGVGMLFGVWSVEYGNAVISNTIAACTVVIIMLYELIFNHKKYKPLSYVGVTVALASIILACVFLG